MMVIIVAMSTVCNNFIQFSEQIALGKFISPSYFSLLTTQECKSCLISFLHPFLDILRLIYTQIA